MTDFRGRFSILSFPSIFVILFLKKNEKTEMKKNRGPENAKSGHFPLKKKMKFSKRKNIGKSTEIK